MTIHPIAPAQTYALRHAVLWPEKPLDYVKLPDDDAGQHFGAFEAEKLVAVISLFVGPDGVARFRKLAADPAWQGRGIGSALLRHTIAAAVAQGAHALWCDARYHTLAFYEQFGLRPEGEVFYKGPIAYVRLQRALP
jgi:GNAT superfamily N-acetyltransferase